MSMRCLDPRRKGEVCVPAVIDRCKCRTQPLAPGFGIDAIEFDNASAPAPQAEARSKLGDKIIELWILPREIGGRIWARDRAPCRPGLCLPPSTRTRSHGTDRDRKQLPHPPFRSHAGGSDVGGSGRLGPARARPEGHAKCSQYNKINYLGARRLKFLFCRSMSMLAALGLNHWDWPTILSSSLWSASKTSTFDR